MLVMMKKITYDDVDVATLSAVTVIPASTDITTAATFYAVAIKL